MERTASVPNDTTSSALLSLLAVAHLIGATVAEVLDARNLRRSWAEHQAKQAGLTVADWLDVPLIPRVDVALIEQNVIAARAELAGPDTFRVLIDTGNAAFDGDNLHAEIARILRTVADVVAHGQTSGVVRDYNGNSVGSWSL